MTKDTNQPKPLTAKQIRHLKSLAHHLKPVVQIGKEDISENVMEATRQELLNHELIKVKIGNNSGVDKKEAATVLSRTTGSSLVQLIGKTIILYKENPKITKGKRIRL